MLKILLCIVILKNIPTTKCQFIDCHEDPTADPEDGPLDEMIYTWLGTLQYIHIKNGTPHYFRVPRVTLISRQFVLSTAVDAAQIPEGYALGNVAFGEYERDEEECGVTIEMLAHGAECQPAALIVPLSDVLLHPEYKHFGAKDSIALLKLLTPVRSRYMVPACLPYKDYLTLKNGKFSKENIFHIDFVSDVPRDLLEEEKEVLKINLLPRELCFLYQPGENRTHLPKNRIMCSTGCGFHTGAPSVVHERTGHWSIVGLSLGGSPCPDPLRGRQPPAPQRHIILYPYVPWITAAITGRALGAFSKDDPFGYMMPRAGIHDMFHEWSGHWWMAGPRCFDRADAALDMFQFYHEFLVVKPSGVTYLNYYMELYAAHMSTIVCIKVGMPYRLGDPKVWGLDSPEVKVRIPVVKFSHTYTLMVEGWAINTTESSPSTMSSSSGD